MIIFPTFDEIQNQKLDAGTYSAFISNHGIYSGHCNTATITIAQWEDYKNTTRIHRTKSLRKYKIFAEDLEWQVNIIKKLVDLLNEGIDLEGLPTTITSKNKYSELNYWLEAQVIESKKK